MKNTDLNLIVIENNANYPPSSDVVINYNPDHKWDGTNYFGANITAYYNLARQKGYSLIYAESTGCNLFFIADEFAKYPFKDMNNIFSLFRPLNDGENNVYHAADHLKRPLLSSSQLLH